MISFSRSTLLPGVVTTSLTSSAIATRVKVKVKGKSLTSL